jgi:hypothetical protein
MLACALTLALALAPATWAQDTKTAAAPAKVTFQASAVKQAVVRKSADAITAAQLKDYLSFVASDEMEGRNTPSKGLDTTAKFLGTMLSRWGAKPAGDDGSYYQKIVLKKEKVNPVGTEVEIGGRKFTYGKDFLAAPPAGTVSAPMVFGGDGWFVKEKNIDAYEGIDPKGKIVVLIQQQMPTGMTQADVMKILMGGKRGVDWMDPAEYALKKGAVGLVVIQSLLTQANADQMEAMRKNTEEGRFTVEKFGGEGLGESKLPTVIAHLNLAQAIFAGAKVDARTVLMSFPGGTPVKPFPLAADRKLTLTVKTTTETATSQNVVAVVEGSDPVLKNEYVAIGAHYDHVGTGNPVNGDAIRNGADDDGSGTVGMLAMAEAFLKAPRRPKRSMLFVWHMGEEKGLWGSKYFTKFPTVPLDKVVAQLNIDMIGRSQQPNNPDPRNKATAAPNEMFVIGSKMMSRELGALSEAVNNAYLKMSFNYKYDDPKDPERFFYRSDHIHYAVKDIPIIFYFTGTHADYHQPSDEVSKIDFQKFEKATRTIYATAWEIGEMKSRPKVDSPLPEDVKAGGLF